MPTLLVLQALHFERQLPCGIRAERLVPTGALCQEPFPAPPLSGLLHHHHTVRAAHWVTLALVLSVELGFSLREVVGMTLVFHVVKPLFISFVRCWSSPEGNVITVASERHVNLHAFLAIISSLFPLGLRIFIFSPLHVDVKMVIVYNKSKNIMTEFYGSLCLYVVDLAPALGEQSAMAWTRKTLNYIHGTAG